MAWLNDAKARKEVVSSLVLKLKWVPLLCLGRRKGSTS
jgi:hypothetical protein